MPPTSFPKPRGRPPKHASSSVKIDGVVKRGRGRPRKNAIGASAAATAAASPSVSTSNISSSAKNESPVDSSHILGNLITAEISKIANNEINKVMRSHDMRVIINKEITLAFAKYHKMQEDQQDGGDDDDEEADEEAGEEADEEDDGEVDEEADEEGNETEEED